MRTRNEGALSSTNGRGNDENERIERAIRAFDIAADRGGDAVESAMSGYRVQLASTGGAT